MVQVLNRQGELGVICVGDALLIVTGGIDLSVGSIVGLSGMVAGGLILHGLRLAPLGVVIYWFTSNIWTAVQQFLVIRNLPTPGSQAAKEREERLARKGKALDANGKIISLERYQAEQQRLLAEAEAARAAAPKRQQPVSKQRAKKQGQKGPATAGGGSSSSSRDTGADSAQTS